MSTTGNRKFGAQKRYSAAGSTRPRSTGTTRQAAPLTGGITRPSRSRCLIRDGGFDGTLIDALMAMPSRYTDPVGRRIGPSSNGRFTLSGAPARLGLREARPAVDERRIAGAAGARVVG